MPTTILEKHIQESLVALYLRLNGFFTSGHILHANTEDERISDNGDIDVLAIRLPYSQENETGVDPSEYLGINAGTLEIIIGEVKSGRQPIHFNESLLNQVNFRRVLYRIGFTDDEKEISRITTNLLTGMSPREVNNSEFHVQEMLKAPFPIRIRPIIFHLSHAAPRRNQAWFVGYEEIMDDI